MMATRPVIDLVRGACPTLSVGLLTADLLSLGSEVRVAESAGVKILHFDVMDGVFCPMMTLGPPWIKAVKTALIKDVHLMIGNPLDTLEAYAAAGADMITVHVEACRHPHRVLQVLKTLPNANDPARGILCGMALNPGTPLEMVQPLMDEVDMVTLLAVNPGWGGQKFIKTAPARIERLLEMIRAAKRDILVGLDGGITRDNLEDVVRMRADIIVTGSAVFDGKDAAGNAREMLATVAKAHKV